MTPKEHAENLVNQYRMILMNGDTDCGHEILCTLIAIQCALISVNEILVVIKKNFINNVALHNGELSYWQEVKQEIEKL